MADDHIGELKKARDQLIKQRRSSISALGDGYKHGDTERQLDNLIRYQRAIEAIDRAIREEEHAAEAAAGVKRRASFIRHEDDPYDDIDSLGGPTSMGVARSTRSQAVLDSADGTMARVARLYCAGQMRTAIDVVFRGHGRAISPAGG